MAVHYGYSIDTSVAAGRSAPTGFQWHAFVVLTAWDDATDTVRYLPGLIVRNTQSGRASYSDDMRVTIAGDTSEAVDVTNNIDGGDYEFIVIPPDSAERSTDLGVTIGRNWSASANQNQYLRQGTWAESTTYTRRTGSLTRGQWNALTSAVLEWQEPVVGQTITWREIFRIANLHEIGAYQDVYRPSGFLGQEWQDVYRPGGELLGYRDVYRPIGGLPDNYKDVYRPAGLLDAYQDVYRPIGQIDAAPRYQDVYGPVGSIEGPTTEYFDVYQPTGRIEGQARGSKWTDGYKISGGALAQVRAGNTVWNMIASNLWVIRRYDADDSTNNVIWYLIEVDLAYVSGATSTSADAELRGGFFTLITRDSDGESTITRTLGSTEPPDGRFQRDDEIRLSDILPSSSYPVGDLIVIPRAGVGGQPDISIIQNNTIDGRALLHRVSFTLKYDVGALLAVPNDNPNRDFSVDFQFNGRSLGTVYLSRFPEWNDVYQPSGQLANNWRDVYQIPGQLPGYTDAYRPEGTIPDRYRDVYSPDGNLIAYGDVYRPEGDLSGFSDVYQPLGTVRGYLDVYRPIGIIGETNHIEVGGMDLGDDLLQASVRIGRSEASHLARILPMQMQLVVDNQAGNWGPGVLTPQTKLRFTWRGIHIATGWVTDVQSSLDNTTGLATVIVRVEGSLARLAKSLYELSLFRADTSKTGDIISDALDQVGWPTGDRDIDKGLVRIHAAHYTSVLAGRRIQRAGPVIRAAEEAEIGLVHEGRGDQVVFRNRLHRELDIQPASDWTLSFQDGDIIPEKVVQNTENWDNVYTNVQVGMERAVVQAERRIWSMQQEVESPIAGVSFVVDVNDPRFSNGLDNQAVRSVVEWSPLEDDHYEGTATISLSNRTRTRTTVTFVTPGTLTKLELHGRGVGLYGDLTIPELADDAAVATYGRRVLSLPTSFIGDGINTGGDAVEEGRAHAELLLWRYSRPPALGRVPINPNYHMDFLRNVEIGDTVAVNPETGLSAGTYHVEGWDFHYSGDGRAEMAVNLSRRGATVLVQSLTPGIAIGNDWTTVIGRGAQPDTDDDLYIYVLYAQLAADDESVDEDTPVVRLRKGSRTFREWTRLDIEVGKPTPLAVVINDINDQYRFDARSLGNLGITASQFRVIRMIR